MKIILILSRVEILYEKEYHETIYMKISGSSNILSQSAAGTVVGALGRCLVDEGAGYSCVCIVLANRWQRGIGKGPRKTVKGWDNGK